jgi:hypothetical protein
MGETKAKESGGVGGLSFRELMVWLIWPRLLAAGRLALRPARMGISMIMLVLIGLIAHVPRLWIRPALDEYNGPLAMGSDLAGAALIKLVRGVIALEHVEAGEALLELFVRVPQALIAEYPWGSLAVFVPALAVWAVGGGAVARMAATEFSLERRTSWTRALAFAISRWGSLFASIAAPLLVVGILIGVMAVGGWLVLGIPYVKAATSLFYFILLLMGFAGVVILVTYLLAMPMLVPAVACEGTDAIDGIQRCYAYVTGRPLKVILYSAILLVQAVVVTVVLAALAQAAVSLAAWSSTLLVGENLSEAVLAQAEAAAQPIAPPVDASNLSGTERFAFGAVRFWMGIPMLLVASFVVSFWFSGGTVLYLLIRQVCDGQDTGELWTPGLIAGTHATPDAGADAAEDDEA